MHHLPPQQSITGLSGTLLITITVRFPRGPETFGIIQLVYSTTNTAQTHTHLHTERLHFRSQHSVRYFILLLHLMNFEYDRGSFFFLFLVFFELSGDIRATDGLRGIWCVFFALVYARVTRAYHWRVISHSAQAAVWILAISQALWLAWLSAWLRANRDTGSRSHDMWGEEWWEMLMMRFCLKKKNKTKKQNVQYLLTVAECGLSSPTEQLHALWQLPSSPNDLTSVGEPYLVLMNVRN